MLLILKLDHDGIRRLLSVSGGEPEEGAEKLGAVVENIGKGGGQPKGVGDIIQGIGAGGTYFWVVDVGDDPPHGTVHGGFSTQGIHTN